jgi:hypothetical protein
MDQPPPLPEVIYGQPIVPPQAMLSQPTDSTVPNRVRPRRGGMPMPMWMGMGIQPQPPFQPQQPQQFES